MQSVDTEPDKACLKALEVTSTGKGSWPAGSPPHGVPLQPGLLAGSEESRWNGTRENYLQEPEIKEIRQEIMSIWKSPEEQHPALCWGSYLQHNPNCEILILFSFPWKRDIWESLLVNPDLKAAYHHRDWIKRQMTFSTAEPKQDIYTGITNPNLSHVARGSSLTTASQKQDLWAMNSTPTLPAAHCWAQRTGTASLPLLI